jgi:hypothetical protein
MTSLPQITGNSLLPLIIIPQRSPQHFYIRITLTEGSSIEFFSATAIAKAEANPAVLDSTSNSSNTTMEESHSNLSQESKLAALTTHLHMRVGRTTRIKNQNVLIRLNTEYD